MWELPYENVGVLIESLDSRPANLHPDIGKTGNNNLQLVLQLGCKTS